MQKQQTESILGFKDNISAHPSEPWCSDCVHTNFYQLTGASAVLKQNQQLNQAVCIEICLL